MGAPAEAVTMQPAVMTGEDHVLAGQLSFDEMLIGQGETRSLFNSLRTSGPGKLMTRLAVTAAAFAGGGEGLVGVASASAQGNSGNIPADVFDWSNVGGNPLVPGGIHSVGQAKAFLESGPGRAALSREGLSGSEAAAVENAVRANKLVSCTIPAGVIIPTMVSGGGEVTTNNVLDDPSDPNGIPGFCVTAVRHFTEGTRKFTETIKDAIAGPCGNALLLGKNTTSVNHPKPKTAEVEVFKIALDDTGRQLVDNNGDAIDPTGEFQFQVTCEDGKKPVNKTVVYNQSPQPLAQCNVGSKVTVNELSTLGPEQWDQLSPGDQSQTVGSTGAEFVYKDEETAPPTPTTPPAPIEVVVPPITVVVPPPVVTPPVPTPPVITPYNAPPGLEQGIENTTYNVYFQADSPSGDSEQVTIQTNDPDCATASPVFQPNPGSSPDLFGSTISFGGDECVGTDIQVAAEVEDINTKLTDTVTEDLGDIQPTPSFGN
jgi:hypothetical protein